MKESEGKEKSAEGIQSCRLGVERGEVGGAGEGGLAR